MLAFRALFRQNRKNLAKGLPYEKKSGIMLLSRQIKRQGMRRSPSPHTPMQETHTLLHNSFCCTIVPIITNLGNICNRVDGSFILAAGKPDRGVGTYVSVMKRGVGSRLRNANVSCTAFLFVSAGNSIWAEEILPPPPGGNRRDFMRYSMSPLPPRTGRRGSGVMECAKRRT